MFYQIRFPEGKDKALTLSYDDGVDTDAQLIELMEKYGIKCTFNLNTGLFPSEGTVRKDEVQFRIPKSEAAKLYNHPLCEVATHGYSHPFYNTLDRQEIFDDIFRDRQILEEMFGKIVVGHAYPYGTYDENTIEALKLAGIVYARTVEAHCWFHLPYDFMRWGATCHHDHTRLFELTDIFATHDLWCGNKGAPWLFYLWGHTYEFRGNNNWDRIETFFEKVAHNENVWYATNREVYEYVTAARNLVVSVDHKHFYNPSHHDVWIALEEGKLCIPSGQTVSL